MAVFRALFGFIPGGTAVVTAIVCAFFTIFTGGSGVTILALGALLYQTLQEDGYPPTLLARPARPAPARSACCCRRRCR